MGWCGACSGRTLLRRPRALFGSRAWRCESCGGEAVPVARLNRRAEGRPILWLGIGLAVLLIISWIIMY